MAFATGDFHTCAVLSTGALNCWGYNNHGQIGNGTTTNATTPTQVSTLTSGVVAVAADNAHTCATLSSGAVKCWGYNVYGHLGNGTTTESWTPVQSGLTSGVTSIANGFNQSCAVNAGTGACWGNNQYGQIGAGVPQYGTLTPVSASSGSYNGGIITSQGSVLVQKFTEAANAAISGHVMPIVYTMVNNTTGKEALMVTYDPLAVAAAMFIDQYDAHIAACNATTSESITETQQQAGTYLWACSNANSKSAYISGMNALLAGARMYLFGHVDASGNPDGCLRNSTVGGVACGTADKIDPNYAHFPYTFVVPGYTSSAYNGDPTVTSGTGAYYYTPLSNALQTYRDGIAASSASKLHRSLQLAGIATFGTDTSAIVTTRVKRSGSFGTTCVSQ